MESSVSSLIGNFSDKRRGRRSIAVFSPVGDVEQLLAFARHIKELGIDGKADFVFVFRPGLSYPELPFPCFFATENFPIGTSGCFFTGQVLCYELGYETVVVADLDAFLDSGKTFDSLVRIAAETGKATVPFSKSPEEKKPKQNYFVINQWGAIPRGVFEKAGFCAPYMQKGGEDWEYSLRLKKRGLLAVFDSGLSTHPKAGRGARAKMAEPKKYYPYLTGLMRAYLLSISYDDASYLRYIAWHCYYSFFADCYGDAALRQALEKSAVPAKNSTHFPTAPGFAIHRLFLAAILVPFRLALGCRMLLRGRKNLSALPFPPRQENAKNVCSAYFGMLNGDR